MPGRIVVLASGSGTNCQALLDATASGELDAEIVGVITNNPTAGVIDRATRSGTPVTVVDHAGSDPQVRRAADERLIAAISTYEPDLVVLAGWMRILGGAVGGAVPIMNLHPALPGAFAGVGAIDRAFDAWRAGDIEESGVMVHWVPDEGVDVGPVIAVVTVGFEANDTLDLFEARMHEAEHRIIVTGAAVALDWLRRQPHSV